MMSSARSQALRRFIPPRPWLHIFRRSDDTSASKRRERPARVRRLSRRFRRIFASAFGGQYHTLPFPRISEVDRYVFPEFRHDAHEPVDGVILHDSIDDTRYIGLG